MEGSFPFGRVGTESHLRVAAKLAPGGSLRIGNIGHADSNEK